ncbi:MAG: peptide deformylase [Sulfurimonas sp.]
MIKTIIKYPTPLSIEYGTDIRVFDEKLFSLIDDLKDSIKENNLEALAAFEIGSYFNVIVFKDENGEYVEMVNPLQIGHSGESIEDERTYYYGDVSAKIKRFENISIVYQDRTGADKTMKLSAKLARTMQRKLDYLFGATFVSRMSEQERENFEKKLDFGLDVGIDDYCPTTFKRDKVLKVVNIAMLLMVVALLGSLFVSEKEMLSKIWQYQLYASFGVLTLQVFYFFYAQYEGKQYTSCVSCSIGNIIGTTAVSFVRLSVVMIASYFLI